MKQVMTGVRVTCLASSVLWATLAALSPAHAEEALAPPPQAAAPSLETGALDAHALDAQRGEGLSVSPLRQEALTQDLAVILWDEVARERGRKGNSNALPPASYSTVQVNLGLR